MGTPFATPSGSDTTPEPSSNEPLQGGKKGDDVKDRGGSDARKRRPSPGRRPDLYRHDLGLSAAPQ